MKLKPPLTLTPKIIFSLIIFVGGVGLSSAIFLKPTETTKTKNDLKKLESEQTNAASPEFDYSASEYGQAIQRAQTYLVNNFDSIIPEHRLILDYMQRKYGLNPRFSAQNSPISSGLNGSIQNPTQFDAFKRIAYPNYLLITLPAANDDPLTQMMMAAIQCDHIQLSPGFGDVVQANLNFGGYNLTHVEFTLQRLKENQCHYFTASQQQAIFDDTAVGMVKLIQDKETTADLRYEAIAFLLDMGRSDLVRATWIQQIVADQQSDGGWEEQISKNNGNNIHSSILALWSLLEYSRPKAPPEPMVHRFNN